MVLIFGNLVGELRLREQGPRHGIGREDSPGNHRYALQQGTATNAFFIELNGFVMRGLLVLPREKRISWQTTFAFLRSQFWRKCLSPRELRAEGKGLQQLGSPIEYRRSSEPRPIGI